MADKLGIGILGCGNISDIYFKTLTREFDWLEVRACSDLMPERAREKAEAYGVPVVCSTEEMLARDDIGLVLNLSTPPVHARLNQLVLNAGKHVYVEKPLALTRADAVATLELAHAKGVRVGCAPDTFLGAGIATCRRLIEEGKIGRVVSATGFMMCHGHEGWHPDPEFYYARGGGPMLDMGPYYLTALVHCLGPIQQVMGHTSTAMNERTISSEKKRGQKIPVETPTHVTGTLRFETGAVATVITSFDTWKSNLKWLEIHGTEGSLQVPNPNNFGGAVKLFQAGAEDWQEIEVDSLPYAENSRGLGVADMALAILNGRDHRASGEMAAHVLDAMLAFEESSNTGRAVQMTLPCRQPDALPADLTSGQPW